jgi:hypothetical protein
MTNKEPENLEITKIYTRIGDIERHLINLLAPIQALDKAIGVNNRLDMVLQIAKTPLRIDDRPILDAQKVFQELNSNLALFAEKTNLTALINAFISLNLIKHTVDKLEQKIDSLVEVVEKISSLGLTANLKFCIGDEEAKTILPVKKKGRR